MQAVPTQVVPMQLAPMPLAPMQLAPVQSSQGLPNQKLTDSKGTAADQKSRSEDFSNVSQRTLEEVERPLPVQNQEPTLMRMTKAMTAKAMMAKAMMETKERQGLLEFYPLQRLISLAPLVQKWQGLSLREHQTHTRWLDLRARTPRRSRPWFERARRLRRSRPRWDRTRMPRRSSSWQNRDRFQHLADFLRWLFCLPPEAPRSSVFPAEMQLLA
jgi:hypothetical protein